MAELSISKERLNYTIDLLVTMAVEEISSFIGKDSKEVLVDFLASKTGKALYDDTTKLWWTGPSYLAEMYLEELVCEAIGFTLWSENFSFCISYLSFL